MAPNNAQYWLEKRSRRKTGYPIGTIAFYGEDDSFASKVVVGIVLSEKNHDVAFMEKWFGTEIDVRQPNEPNPENAVKDLVSFLPVLAYDGANMTQIDAGGILDIAMAGTSATLLARKWESALLVNVDNYTLRRILDNPEAMAAVERIEGWRSLGETSSRPSSTRARS
jgi:hypothetical protein